jgi:hypothetical protein
MMQDGDRTLSCPALDRQIADNEAAAAQLLHKDKDVERKNTAKVVAGAVPYVGLLLVASTDLSNEEQVKARAIIDRNEWLNFLVRQKGCKQ